jgi:hypothetical protein
LSVTAEGPAWLAGLQALLGEALRTPLDRATGTLRPNAAALPAELWSALQSAGGWGAYNLQYWLRLFEAFQAELPLTCRVLGAWRFNQEVERLLLARPPTGWDLARAAEGFDAFLASALPSPPRNPLETCPPVAPPRGAVVEAARIDLRWSEVLRAPETAPLHLQPGDADQLTSAMLQRAPGAALTEEHWPLLELRRALGPDAPESPLALPSRLSAANHWLLIHRDGGVLQVPLEADEARLFTLLDSLPLQDALGQLEEATPPEQRASLPARTQRWLSRALQLGVWSGLR